MREESREQYILKIRGNTQNYITRLRIEEEKGPQNFSFWYATIAQLVCLAQVVSKNFDKLINIEELREFYSLYSVANIIHDDKNPLETRQSALESLKLLINQSIPRYAYLLDMSEQELLAQMEQEKGILKKSQTAIVKQDGGLIIDRTLKLRQSTKEPDKMVPRGKIISIEERLGEDSPTEYARRRMQKESTLKRHLAYLLKMSYENIKEFEARYKKYSDFRHNVKDVAKTINPIIRNEKVRKMQEHLFKLERYHRTISGLYNTLYDILINHYDELSPDELNQIESLFLLYETMTVTLKDSIGDTTVTTMERRRLRLQEQITKYNGYIDQIIVERENGNPGYTGDIIPYSSGNPSSKKA